MPYFLNVSLGAEYSESFSCMYLSKTALPIDSLPDAVCSFDEYAMNLDRSIGYDSFKSREQNVSNNKDSRDYKLFVISCHGRI